jgi:hypothetical protein
VKFETTAAFQGDLARLSPAERALFRKVVHEDFNPTCERRLVDPTAAWPAKLRVRKVENAPGIWEMTWSFSGPDGRATFEWIVIDGEPAIRWRRIGGHAIFREP